MANVYVEARPKGHPEGTVVVDYFIEDHAEHLLARCRTQEEALEWARSRGHAPLVPLIRHLNDKMKPDHWRSAQERQVRDGAHQRSRTLRERPGDRSKSSGWTALNIDGLASVSLIVGDADATPANEHLSEPAAQEEGAKGP